MRRAGSLAEGIENTNLFLCLAHRTNAPSWADCDIFMSMLSWHIGKNCDFSILFLSWGTMSFAAFPILLMNSRIATIPKLELLLASSSNEMMDQPSFSRKHELSMTQQQLLYQ
jgi:hypothetical protein